MLLMEHAFANEVTQPTEGAAFVQKNVDSNVDSDTFGKPYNE